MIVLCYGQIGILFGLREGTYSRRKTSAIPHASISDGLVILIELNSMAAGLSFFMAIYYRRENARRNRDHKVSELYTEEEKELERSRGDHATLFRYSFQIH